MILDKGYTIRVAEERCLNNRHNRVNCDHCVEICPIGAIEVLRGHVGIDKDVCKSCGVCLSTCPTGVFYSNQLDETTILNSIDQNNWETTEFYCSEHGNIATDDNNRKKGAIRVPACLASISQGAWFEIGLRANVDLYVDECADCPMKKAQARLEYNMGIAAEWLEASGHKARISFLNRCESDPSRRTKEIVDAGLKLTSRRDLFLSLVNHAKRAAEGLDFEAEHVSDKKAIPAWRERFARVYPENAVGDPSSAAFWPTITIDAGCVNCGICALFCPTGALSIDEAGGLAAHRFTSGLCLDCRICEMTCTLGVIHRDREQVPNPFETRTLSTELVAECARCGETTTENEYHLCYWCRQEDHIQEDLKNTLTGSFVNYH